MNGCHSACAQDKICTYMNNTLCMYSGIKYWDETGSERRLLLFLTSKCCIYYYALSLVARARFETPASISWNAPDGAYRMYRTVAPVSVFCKIYGRMYLLGTMNRKYNPGARPATRKKKDTRRTPTEVKVFTWVPSAGVSFDSQPFGSGGSIGLGLWSRYSAREYRIIFSVKYSPP